MKQIQTEALLIAEELEKDKWHLSGVAIQTAAHMLRRQHARIAKLEEDRILMSIEWDYTELALNRRIAELEAENASLREKRKSMKDEEVNRIWEEECLSLPEVCRHIYFSRRVEFLHGIGGSNAD